MTEQPVARIVSLLPSATELVCALGLRESLAGISHECDYPPGVETLPRVTRTRIAHDASSREIDEQVRRELAGAQALYSLDMQVLPTLAPALLVTQSLCDVCAVGADEVESALCRIPGAPQLFNLQPERLGDPLDADRPAELLARGGAGDDRDAVGLQQRRADSLGGPGGDQQGQARRDPAQRRGGRDDPPPGPSAPPGRSGPAGRRSRPTGRG